MAFSYKPLWKLLIEKDMTKEDLRVAINISSRTMAKMSKGENVSMDVLHRLCEKFHCQLSELVEFLPDHEPNGEKEAVSNERAQG